MKNENDIYVFKQCHWRWERKVLKVKYMKHIIC